MSAMAVYYVAPIAMGIFGLMVVLASIVFIRLNRP